MDPLTGVQKSLLSGKRKPEARENPRPGPIKKVIIMELERVKGTADYSPQEMVLREEIVSTIAKVLNKYGFMPLDTPVLEKWETLTVKSGGGEEIAKETYNFTDQGGRRLGLRYDLTVPSARYLAMNPKVPMPFKRYQYGKVFRYQEVKPGRLREFYQFDADIYGTESLLADAECIALATDVFKELGFKSYEIRINNKKLLQGLMNYAKVKPELVVNAYRAIDKLDKIGVSGVRKELEDKGISKESVENLLKIIEIKGGPEELIKKVEALVPGNEGIKELKELIKYLKTMNLKNYSIDLSLVRGLEYYTGSIFEVSAEGLSVSFAGGGRYDKMISQLIGADIPAVGISFGVEPIFQTLIKKAGLKITRTQFYLAPISEDQLIEGLKIASQLRAKGLNVEVDLKNRNLSKNIEFAGKKGIKYLIIVGSKDLKEGKVTLRNLETGKEEKVKPSDIS